MTLHDDLNRLASRGTPCGADAVFDAAVSEQQDEYYLPVKTRTQQSRRAGAPRWAVAAAAIIAVIAVGAVALSALDSSEVVDTAQGPAVAGPAPSESAPSTTAVSAERVTSMDMVLSHEIDRSGWVDEGRVFPVDDEIPEPLPVFDENGRQIAWWGFALGWIDLDQMASPSYDFASAYKQNLDRADQIHQDRPGS